MKSVSFVLIVVLSTVCLFDCSAGGGTEAEPTPAEAPNVVSGCSKAPACGACGTCAERCFCEHQDTAVCADVCSTAGAPPPTATAPSAPTASSPTTAPTSTPTSMPTVAPTATATPTATSTGTGTSPVPPAYQSVTVSTVHFDVLPGQELFRCQNFKNPVGRDIAIVESESFMAPGSHHMFLFREPTIVADSNAVEACSGVEFRDYVHLAQAPQIKWTYPPGVARLLGGGDGLRIAVHYVNATGQALSAQVSVKLSYVERNEVTYLAAPIFLNQALLAVPPGQSTASRQFAVPYAIQMIRAVGHMHARGTLLTAVTNSGQSVYETTVWDEPEERVFDPPLAVAGGSTITWSCTYQNDTGNVLTFGESATANEMCILYGLFYPADAGANQGVSLGGLL